MGPAGADQISGGASYWRRPAAVAAGLGGLAVSAPLALIASCNIHELGHALVATALGWRVERVNLCLPGAGSVDYSHVGLWAGNLQGYAGGVVGALFLYGLYQWVFARPRRPLRGPVWWGTGVGAVMWIGPQLVIAVLEGRAGPGEDYTELIAASPAAVISIVLLSMAVAVALYAWRWRFAWTSPT